MSDFRCQIRTIGAVSSMSMELGVWCGMKSNDFAKT